MTAYNIRLMIQNKKIYKYIFASNIVVACTDLQARQGVIETGIGVDRFIREARQSNNG